MNGYYIKWGSCTNINITRLHAFQRARAHACMASYFTADVRPVFMAMASQILMEMPMHLCWKMKKQQLIKFRNQECFSHLTDISRHAASQLEPCPMRCTTHVIAMPYAYSSVQFGQSPRRTDVRVYYTLIFVSAKRGLTHQDFNFLLEV